jgi:hypothetical protein
MFRIGSNPVDLTIQDWGGYIGQWDNRIWNRKQEPVPPRVRPPGAPTGGDQAAGAQAGPPSMGTVQEYAGLTAGFITVADKGGHRTCPLGAAFPSKPLMTRKRALCLTPWYCCSLDPKPYGIGSIALAPCTPYSTAI